MLEWVWKRKSSYTIGGNVNWYKRYKETIELPYDPEILLLDINLEKTINQKDTRTPMFIKAWFTIDRHGSRLNDHQQRTDKEDVVHICNGVLLSH